MGKLFNRAGMTVTGTPGTGTVTLNVAITSPKKYLSFSDAGVANSDVVSYLIEDGVEFEHGIGTYTSSGTTLSRDTVRKSSNAGAKISATSAALVYIDAGAEDIEQAASDSQAGRVELATNAETRTGTDTGRAVTPAGLASAHGVVVRKGSDTSRSSTTTETADPDLQFSMAASTTYDISLVVKLRSPAAADFKYGMTGPASPTEVYGGENNANIGAIGTFEAYPTGQTRLGVADGASVIAIEMTVENGANSGTFSFNWAQNTSNAGATIVKAGSTLTYRVI